MKKQIITVLSLGFMNSLMAGDVSSGGPNMPVYSVRSLEMRTLVDSPKVMNAIGINHEITEIRFQSKEGATTSFEISTNDCSIQAAVTRKPKLGGPVPVVNFEVSSIFGNCAGN